MPAHNQPENENRPGTHNTRPANGSLHADASNNLGHFTPNFTMSESERKRRLSAVYSILLEAADTAEKGKGGGNEQ
jgi:hypothetical protein